MSLVKVAVILLRAHHLIIFILDHSCCTFRRRDVLGNLIFVCLTVVLQFALELLLTLIEDISIDALVLAE